MRRPAVLHHIKVARSRSRNAARASPLGEGTKEGARPFRKGDVFCLYKMRCGVI